MDFNVSDFNVRLRTIRIRELIAFAIVALIITVLLAMVFPIFSEYDDLVLISFFGILFLFFVYALRGTHGLRNNFSKLSQKENQREIFYVLAINFVFAFFIVALLISIDYLFSFSYPESASMIEYATESYDSLTFLFDILTSILIAPILEELIFRGVIFNRLKIKTSIVIAMLVSSLLFAIGHEFGGMTSAFVFGMCMCIIYLKTDNILMTISIHFLNNLLVVLMEMTDIEYYMFDSYFVLITLIVSIIAGVLIVRYIYRETKELTQYYYHD